MSIKVVVSKAAHLTAILHYIYYAPLFRNYPLFSIFHGPTSRLLYVGSLIIENNLWRELFEAVIGRSEGGAVSDIISELESVEVYK